MSLSGDLHAIEMGSRRNAKTTYCPGCTARTGRGQAERSEIVPLEGTPFVPGLPTSQHLPWCECDNARCSVFTATAGERARWVGVAKKLAQGERSRQRSDGVS